MKNILTKNKGGFTLIEAMISAAVLSIGILVTLDLISISMVSKIKSKDIIIANNLAKQVLEDVKNLGYETAADTTNNPTRKAHDVKNADGSIIYSYAASSKSSDFPNMVMTQQVTAANKIYTLTFTEDEDTPTAKLVKVRVNVSWTTMGKAHSIVFNTYANM